MAQSTQAHKSDLWGSTYVNIDGDAIVNRLDEHGTWGAAKLAIEPFRLDLSFVKMYWWEVLAEQKTPIFITGLEDDRLNGQAVTVQYAWMHHKDIEKDLERANQDSFATVNPHGWKVKDVLETDEKTEWPLMIGETVICTKTKTKIEIKYKNLKISDNDKIDRLRMRFSTMLRLKKQTHIGICYFPCIRYHWNFRPDQSGTYWLQNDCSAEDGVVDGAGQGIVWMFLHDSIPDIFKKCNRIKIDIYMHQILQYPHDLKSYWEDHGEKDAKNIVKDQMEIRKMLQPLLWNNEERINDAEEKNEKLQDENDKLKQELAALREQMKEIEINDECEQKEVEFDVETWLKKIKLEKYCKLLIESGYDDLESILDLNAEDLKEIGIIPGHRKKILKAVQKLKEQ